MATIDDIVGQLGDQTTVFDDPEDDDGDGTCINIFLQIICRSFVCVGVIARTATHTHTHSRHLILNQYPRARSL